MNSLSNISSYELATLANSLALYFSKNYSSTDITKLITFFTSLADILALLAVDKVEDDILKS